MGTYNFLPFHLRVSISCLTRSSYVALNELRRAVSSFSKLRYLISRKLEVKNKINNKVQRKGRPFFFIFHCCYCCCWWWYRWRTTNLGNFSLEKGNKNKVCSWTSSGPFVRSSMSCFYEFLIRNISKVLFAERKFISVALSHSPSRFLPHYFPLKHISCNDTGFLWRELRHSGEGQRKRTLCSSYLKQAIN